MKIKKMAALLANRSTGVHLAILLFSLFVLASAICFTVNRMQEPTTYIEIIYDKETLRITEIYSVYIDSQGKLVKHGESFEIHYSDAGYVTYAIYDHGKAVDGFQISHSHGGPPLEELSIAKRLSLEIHK